MIKAIRNAALPVAVIAAMLWSTSQRANSSEDYEQHDQRVLLSLGSLLKEKGWARDYEINPGRHSFDFVGVTIAEHLGKKPDDVVSTPESDADQLADIACRGKYISKHPLYGVWKVHVLINGELAAQCFISGGN